METSGAAQLLSEQDVADIRLFCEVAQVHDSHLSIDELSSLLRISLSKEELERAWSLQPALNEMYALRSGFIVPRRHISYGDNSELETQLVLRNTSAEALLDHAQTFSHIVKGREVRLLSVSGSASYRSASPKDDVDFFCITAQQAAWIYIAKVLVLARIYRLLHRGSPDICLSCIMDEEYAVRRFREERDALFARDAMNVHVIRGSSYYMRLLGEAEWISAYFPRLYERATKPSEFSGGEAGQENSGLLTKILNHILYQTVGRYIRLKAYLLNRKYSKKGWSNSLFKTMVGVDHCIYESVRYANLREKYRQIELLSSVT